MSLFILLGLIIYNYILSNKILLIISIFLFIVFFILDYIYDSKNLKSEDECVEKNYLWKEKSEAYTKKRKDESEQFTNDLEKG